MGVPIPKWMFVALREYKATELIKGGIVAAGMFLTALGWAVPSQAEPMNLQGTSRYFTSDLLPLRAFSDWSATARSTTVCEGRCLRGNVLLAEKKRRKSPTRKVSTSTDESPGPKLNKDYFTGVLSDTKYIFLSPLGWGAADWIKTSLVAGATGAFFLLDDEIRDYVQDKRNGTTDDIAAVFEPFGNGNYSLPGLAAFYVYGHFAKNERAMRAALLSVESFAATGLFTLALKFSTGRVRPSLADGSGEWSGFNFDDVSFPSGHTASAFAVATVLASEYDDKPLVAPVAYSLAALTGLSRINDNKHWAADVFFGGVLGYFVSKTVLKLHSKKKGRHYTIYPRISRGETGLEFAYRF